MDDPGKMEHKDEIDKAWKRAEHSDGKRKKIMGKKTKWKKPESPKKERESKVVWIYLPFIQGSQEDMRGVANRYLEERQIRNPRDGKEYRLVEHDGTGNGLKDVKPGDTVYVFAHGASGDSDHIYTHDRETMTADTLAEQMLVTEGLNPDKVNLKIGSCYGVGDEHLDIEASKSLDTFTKNFARTFGNKSLELRRGLPTHVDGYVGTVQNQNMVVDSDGKRHRGAHVKKGSSDHTKMQMYEFMEPPDRDAAKAMTDPYRAKNNRLRYTFRRGGGGVEPVLDEEDFDRAKRSREEAEMAALTQRFAGSSEVMQNAIGGRGGRGIRGGGRR